MGSPTVSAVMYPKLADGEFAFYRSVAEFSGVRGFSSELLRMVLDRVDVGDYALSGIPDAVWLCGVFQYYTQVSHALKHHGKFYSEEDFIMTMKMAALKEAADNEQRL